jgi:choline dehydrogenase-like flavoprotein
MGADTTVSDQTSSIYDYIFVGAGIAGPFMAHELCKAGCRCLMLEAGKHYTRQTYPRNDLDGTSQLYWSGGMELGQDCKIVFLRPKAVGGGSIVNQALVDRFDDDAFDSWRETSGVDFFDSKQMEPWYDRAEAEISIQYIPEAFKNENARIFTEGFEKLGYKHAPLRRAQKDCRYEEGNCCIECLNGCRIGSKQSTPETVLKKALAFGLELKSEFEVMKVAESNGGVTVEGIDSAGNKTAFAAANLVLSAGAIGNSKLLLNSGFGKKLPAIGNGFYCHPQYMNFALYDHEIKSHLGAFQAFKSDDTGFRKGGFKLENVYSGPGAVAMLLGMYGKRHHQYMEKLPNFACIEVATRDTQPGRILLGRKGNAVISKTRNKEDIARYERGIKVVNEIFRVTGATEIINGAFGIGLHLMGGCNMGLDPSFSVVDPEFRLHGFKNIFAADSSIFPNAPGINPSLTIMALAKKAAATILKERSR